jgi:hypothetical protein
VNVTRLRRLSQGEIGVLRSLIRRSGAGGAAVTLSRWQRRLVVELWRRQLVYVWYRQAPETVPSLQGPYFSLSIAGLRLASLFAAPRPRRQNMEA